MCVRLLVLPGVMSRRGRRRAPENASGGEARRRERDQPHSPLLENHSRQRPTTSYASMNSIDVTDHYVTF